MFKLWLHSVNNSKKSCFRLRQNISTGQLSCLAFQLPIEWAILVDIPVDQFYYFMLQDMDIFFQIAYVHDVDLDSGTLVSREPQTRRLYN